MINPKDATENQLPLKIHVIVPGQLVPIPSVLEEFECGKSISKFYTLLLQHNDGFRGKGAFGWRRESIDERGEGGIEVESHPNDPGIA